jgi:hypothetical protein
MDQHTDSHTPDILIGDYDACINIITLDNILANIILKIVKILH